MSLITFTLALEFSDLRSLRLLSRRSNEIASQYLFRTVVVRPRTSTLETLINISRTNVFAKGVRELIWETAHYFDSLSGFQDAGTQQERNRRRDLLNKEWTPQDLQDEADSWLEDEAKILSADPVARLAPILAQFTGLNRVRLCSWSKRMETLKKLWQEDAYALDEEDGKPGKLPLFVNREYEDYRQGDAFYFLLRALGVGGRSVESLHVQPAEPQIASQARQNMVDDPMLDMLLPLSNSLVTERSILQLLSPLQRLKSLHLRCRQDSERITDLTAGDRLGLFLTQLRNLEDLELSLEGTVSPLRYLEADGRNARDHLGVLAFVPLPRLWAVGHTFTCLRRLAFDSVWLDGTELCDFLKRHSSTLKVLMLTWVMLGREASAEDLERGMLCSKCSVGGNDESDTSSDSSCKQDHEEDDCSWPSTRSREEFPLLWLQLAQACSKMPLLEIVRFENIFETLEGTAAPVKEKVAQELEQLALRKAL